MKYILLCLTVFIGFFSGKTPTHDLKSIEIYAITFEKQYPTKMSLKEVKRHPETHVKETHVSVQSYSGIETALAKLKKDPDAVYSSKEDDYRAVAILRYKRITRTIYIAGNGRICYNGVLYLPQPDLLKELYFFIPERYGINKHTEDFYRQRYGVQQTNDIKPQAPAKVALDSTAKKK